MYKVLKNYIIYFFFQYTSIILYSLFKNYSVFDFVLSNIDFLRFLQVEKN